MSYSSLLIHCLIAIYRYHFIHCFVIYTLQVHCSSLNSHTVNTYACIFIYVLLSLYFFQTQK